MALDIMLDFERLRAAQAGLRASIEEFTNASKINDSLEHAVGRPDERSSLRDKVSDFESAWDGKRGKLADNLQSIEDQLKNILDGWEKWDVDAAGKTGGSGSTSSVTVNGAR